MRQKSLLIQGVLFALLIGVGNFCITPAQVFAQTNSPTSFSLSSASLSSLLQVLKGIGTYLSTQPAKSMSTPAPFTRSVDSAVSASASAITQSISNLSSGASFTSALLSSPTITGALVSLANGSASAPSLTFDAESTLGLRRVSSGIAEFTGGVYGFGSMARSLGTSLLSGTDSSNGHVFATNAPAGSNLATFIDAFPEGARVNIVSTGNGAAQGGQLQLINRHAVTSDGGTTWSFTPMNSQDIIGLLSFRGTRNSSGSLSTAGANSIVWQARQAFTDSAQGTFMQVELTPLDATTPRTVEYLDTDRISFPPQVSLMWGGVDSQTSLDLALTRQGTGLLQIHPNDTTKGVILNVANTDALTLRNHSNTGNASFTAGALTTTAGVTFSGIANGAGTAYLCQTLATGVVSTSTSACNPSSIRFKENVQNLDPSLGLAAVRQLRPVSYTYKPELLIPGNQIGLIAEETYPIVPQVVGVDASGTPSNIDYAKLAPVLIEAIQQLDAEVNSTTTSTSTQTVTDNSGFLDDLAYVGGTVTDNVIHFAELVVDHLHATLVTTDRVELKDQDTGGLVCVEAHSGVLTSTPGACGSNASSTPAQ